MSDIPVNNTKTTEKANLAFQIAVGLFVILVNGFIVWVVCNINVPDANRTAFNIIMGNALGWVQILLAFGFPGSINSAKAQDAINKLIAGKGTGDGQGTTSTSAGVADGGAGPPAAEPASAGPASFSEPEPSPEPAPPDSIPTSVGR